MQISDVKECLEAILNRATPSFRHRPSNSCKEDYYLGEEEATEHGESELKIFNIARIVDSFSRHRISEAGRRSIRVHLEVAWDGAGM